MRDDFGVHGVFVITGAVLLAAILGIFLAVAAAVAPNSQGGGHYRSFYFEARIEVPETVDDDILGEMKAWYEAPGRWRYEFSSYDPTRVHETVIQVSNGQQYWLYRGETNTYATGDAKQYLSNFGLPETEAPPPPSFGLLLGPAPLGDVHAYLQALAEAGNTTLTTQASERTIAGRRADRVDMSGPGDHTSSVWLDQDYDFILRFETPYAPSSPEDAAAGSLEAEVLIVEFNQAIDDTVFAFEPPPGSREASPDDGTSVGSGSSGSLGENVPPPDGFFAVTDLPEGYEATLHEQSGTAQGITSYGVTYEAPDGSGTLRVQQTLRAGGLADSQRTGEPVTIGDSQAYLQREGGETALLWADGDLVIRVSTNTLDVDELLRVAESMRP